MTGRILSALLWILRTIFLLDRLDVELGPCPEVVQEKGKRRGWLWECPEWSRSFRARLGQLNSDGKRDCYSCAAVGRSEPSSYMAWPTSAAAFANARL